MGLISFPCEEIFHGILDFTLKTCISGVIFSHNSLSSEDVELPGRQPFKKRTSFSDGVPPVLDDSTIFHDTETDVATCEAVEGPPSPLDFDFAFPRRPSSWCGDDAQLSGAEPGNFSPLSICSRKNLTEFVRNKMPEAEQLHYSQISGGKLEVLSVDDDPINQVCRKFLCGERIVGQWRGDEGSWERGEGKRKSGRNGYTEITQDSKSA
jgi:hypothetical protein